MIRPENRPFIRAGCAGCGVTVDANHVAVDVIHRYTWDELRPDIVQEVNVDVAGTPVQPSMGGCGHDVHPGAF